MSMGKHTKVYVLVVVLIALVVTSNFTIQSVRAASIPPLYTATVELPIVNAGPTAPLIVKPGECSILELTGEINASRVYIYTVTPSPDGSELRELSYDLVFNYVNSTLLKVCIPVEAEQELYDLVIVDTSGNVYKAPRSIWVLREIPSRVRIAFMSDLHFGTGPETVYAGDVNRVSAFILASALNSTIVIWGGDITDRDAESEAKAAQIYRYTLLYNKPVFSVPGNHDHPGSNYKRFLGPTRWYRVIDNKILIVGIYTVPYESENNVITWDEIAFLEEALSKYRDVPYKIIVTHYPMFYYQGELTTRYDDEEVLKPYVSSGSVSTPVSSYWSGNMTAFRYVLKLIEDYNVTLVLAGHIHEDKYVKYTSTRTNTTTYFITTTTAAHGTSTYQGITLFEIDLNTGEIMFPVTQPGFIGFSNTTGPTTNAIRVYSAPSRLIKTTKSYYLEVGNELIEPSLSLKTTILLPWVSGTTPIIEFNKDGVELSKLASKLVGDTLYLYIDAVVYKGGSLRLFALSEPDTSPPDISISSIGSPTLNKTFTVYISIQDDVTGIDPARVVIKFNTSASIQVSFTPSTLLQDLDKVTYIVKITVRGASETPVLLAINVTDNYGRITTRKYIIVFYPPGTTPTTTPIREYTEPTPTPTLTPTPTSTPTPTPTLTPTPTPTPTTSTLTTTPSTTLTTSMETQTKTTPGTTTTSTTSLTPTTPATSIATTTETSQIPSNITTTVVVIVVVAIVVVVLVVTLRFLRRR